MDKSSAMFRRSPREVELRLIAAFRAMPSCPVFSAGGKLRAAAAGQGTALAEVLAWSAVLDGDPAGRRYLWSWARCQAFRSSYAELCEGMGWSRSTAEAGRRRAAATIAAGLAAAAGEGATTARLDSGKADAGTSRAAGCPPLPADA